jgi:hypothetical protein
VPSEQSPNKVVGKHDLQIILEEFARETDRAAVILGVARIDELLHHTLGAVLLPCATKDDTLLDTERPLSTLSARIDACYRLGLIDAEFAWTLHIIRRIRNELAHASASARLDERPHVDRINQLVGTFKERASFKQLRGILAALQALKTGAGLDLLTIIAMAVAVLAWLAQTCKRLTSTAPVPLTAVSFSAGSESEKN